MRIEEAVKALQENKIVHSPNSFETFKAFEDELGTKVECSLVDSNEKQIMYLSRFAILYKYCDFALGKQKTLKPVETESVEG